ncbi:MAG: formimidoylglutamate deiminase [Rhodobacteraceae bacterium]|nr:formimidoylglutamate deiminase [Paracoccaceae bacterium]
MPQYIHANHTLTADGWRRDIQISISDQGRITGIGPQNRTATNHVSLALPAPANLHSHVFQRAMSGLTEQRGPDGSDSFWTWRNRMFRFLNQLSPDHMMPIARLVFMEMLEAGFASVAEFHYLHHDINGQPYADPPEMAARIIAAAQSTGIGLTLLPVLYQFGGCDGRALTGGQARFGNTPESFANLYSGTIAAMANSPDDFTIGVAPHSLRAVSPTGLSTAIDLCPEGPIHMHLAEQIAEITQVTAALGASPTRWLLDNYSIDHRWCLIHCTQMSDTETHDLAQTKAIAGLCPITESNLGDGIFRGTEFLSHEGRIGFGSDSNVHVSLFEELKTFEYSQRLRDHSRAALATAKHSSGRVLFDHAAHGGAQAAGRNSGMIAPGMLADIIGIETDNQWLCNRDGDTVLDSLIFGGHGQDCITDVWSAGRHVVRHGQHIQRDKIIRDFINTISKLEQQT